MKLTRALLLSSKKQAVSHETSTFLCFSSSAYRYLVTKTDDGLRFQIFRMVTETYVDNRKQERERRVPVATAHVEEMFTDEGEMLNYLHRYQIDSEEHWQPVEE